MEPLDGKPWVGQTLKGRPESLKMIIYVGCQISVVDTDMYAGQKSLKVDGLAYF